MAELVDAPVLGTGFARSEGSSPFIRMLTFEWLNNIVDLYVNCNLAAVKSLVSI